MNDKTRTIRVRRTYLVQYVQEWDVEIPADYDTDEWQDNDLSGFDQYICDNGTIVSQSVETLDNDGLQLKVEN